eukprot:COSAG01_NODE_1564_length_9896_cov_4.868837_12_plen_215_part_00
MAGSQLARVEGSRTTFRLPAVSSSKQTQVVTWCRVCGFSRSRRACSRTARPNALLLVIMRVSCSSLVPRGGSYDVGRWVAPTPFAAAAVAAMGLILLQSGAVWWCNSSLSTPSFHCSSACTCVCSTWFCACRAAADSTQWAVEEVDLPCSATPPTSDAPMDITPQLPRDSRPPGAGWPGAAASLAPGWVCVCVSGFISRYDTELVSKVRCRFIS